MKKTPRLHQLFIFVMLLSLIASACSTAPASQPSAQPAQKQQTQPNTPETGPSGSSQPPQPAEPAQPAQSGQPAAGASITRKYAGTTLVVSWPSLSHFKKAAELIPEFEQETGITVEVDFIEYMKLHDKQVLEMSKPQGGDYDVVAWTIFWKNEFVAKGLLTPLSQFFANPPLVMPDYDPEDIVPAYLESGAVVGGQKGYLPGVTQGLYGVPFGAETSILAYRTDLFEQHNLKVPETYDELLQTATWISQNVPNMKGFTSRGASGHQITAAWLLHLSPYGGAVFDDQWNPILNNAAGVQAAETLKTLLDNSPAGVNSYGFGEAANAFLQGQAAMYLDSHKIAAMSRDPRQSTVDGRVGFALHPRAQTCLSETGGQAMGIPANSKNKEAAFLFIQWMTSRRIDKKIAEIGGDPIRKSTLADPELQQTHPEYPILLKQLECANVDWRPLIPEWDSLNSPIIGVALSEFATGSKTAQQALDEAATKIKEAMDRNGYYSWNK